MVDVENTLLPYDWQDDMGGTTERIASWIQALGDRVVFVSNSRTTSAISDLISGARVIARARKPFTRLRRLREALSGVPAVAVIGDQVLTDGLLAFRLGVVFVHVRSIGHGEPVWPKIMRHFGNTLQMILFESVDCS